MNPDKPLTQTEFIQRLKDDLEMPLSAASVRKLISQHMPIVSIGIKPRFHYPTCRAWILSSREIDPAALAIRDRLYKRQLSRAS